MAKTLFILNDPPYGTERSYNALRLAGSLSKHEGEQVRVFLIGEAAACAHGQQKVPQGHYNIEVMLKAVAKHGGQIGVCASWRPRRPTARARVFAREGYEMRSGATARIVLHCSRVTDVRVSIPPCAAPAASAVRASTHGRPPGWGLID